MIYKVNVEISIELYYEILSTVDRLRDALSQGELLSNVLVEQALGFLEIFVD